MEFEITRADCIWISQCFYKAISSIAYHDSRTREQTVLDAHNKPSNLDLRCVQVQLVSFLLLSVQILSIFHWCMVWIEKSDTRVTDRHHELAE